VTSGDGRKSIRTIGNNWSETSFFKKQFKTINNMNNSEYLAQFNEKDVINVFKEIIKADFPSTSFINRDVDIIDVDIIDVEMFLDEHCVAIGFEGIADLIANEYNKRADKYFGCVTDKTAKEMALSALRENFLYDGYTMYKADSPFASAFDWLDEKYK
jgi:hypothetical protein